MADETDGATPDDVAQDELMPLTAEVAVTPPSGAAMPTRQKYALIGAAEAVVILVPLAIVLATGGDDDSQNLAPASSIAATTTDAGATSLPTGSTATTVTGGTTTPTSIVVTTPTPMMSVPGVGFALTPNGKVLATAGADGRTTVWNVASRAEVLTVQGDGTHLAFNGDGSMLLTATDRFSSTYAGTSHTWRTADGAHLASFPADSTGVVGFAPSGAAVIGVTSGVAQFWDAITGGEGGSFGTYGTAAGFWVISPDGRTLAMLDVADGVPSVQVFDVTTGQLKHVVRDPGGCDLVPVGFAPDSRRLLMWNGCTDSDGMLYASAVLVWDTASNRQSVKIDGVIWGTGLAFSPDGSKLVGAAVAGPGTRERIAMWDTTSGALLAAYDCECLLGTSSGMSVSFSPDGRLVAVSTDTNGFMTVVYDVATMQPRYRIPGLVEAHFGSNTLLVGIIAADDRGYSTGFGHFILESGDVAVYQL